MIVSAAAQLTALVRPTPFALLDIAQQVKLIVSRPHRSSLMSMTLAAGIIKYHLCTALRTAITVHVAEILRDAGPKVTMFNVQLSVSLRPTFLCRESTCRRSPSPPRFTTANWVGTKQTNYVPFINNAALMPPARILRLLATNYIFTEVTPDVFANNRLSSTLDTGKSVEELLAKLVLSLSSSNGRKTKTNLAPNRNT
jgi:hypothetical protein